MKNEIRLALLSLAAAAAPAFAQNVVPQCGPANFDKARNVFTVIKPAAAEFVRGQIAEALAMTVDEAVPYFSAVNKIHDRLKILQQVGLGYIALGQQALALSNH